eukprot:3607444-Prymnesium_polylepis.1
MQRLLVALQTKGDASERLLSSLVGPALLISVDEIAKTLSGTAPPTGYVSVRAIVNQLWLPVLSPSPPMAGGGGGGGNGGSDDAAEREAR